MSDITTYWICEHKTGDPMKTLRFQTKQDFDDYIGRRSDLRSFVQREYDLPRKVTVTFDNILTIIKACLDKGYRETLVWEQR